MAADEPWCWCAPPSMPLHRPSVPNELMALSGARLVSLYQSSESSLSVAAGFISIASCSARPEHAAPQAQRAQRADGALWHAACLLYQSNESSLSIAAGFISIASCSARPPNGRPCTCRFSPRPAAYRSVLSAWHLAAPAATPATAARRPGPRSHTSGVLYNINTEESRIGLHNGNSLPLLQRVRSKASFSLDANLLDLYSLLSGAPNLVLSTVRNHPASDSESAGADIALSRVKSLPADSSGEVISSGGRTEMLAVAHLLVTSASRPLERTASNGESGELSVESDPFHVMVTWFFTGAQAVCI
jgi:hypothetical protein